MRLDISPDRQGLETAFVARVSAAAETACAEVAAAPNAATLPVWLAERGVDVWGVDLRWTRVIAASTSSVGAAGRSSATPSCRTWWADGASPILPGLTNRQVAL